MIDSFVALLLTFQMVLFPYVSQESPTAQEGKNDCGYAVLSMVIEGMTNLRIPVDDLAPDGDDGYFDTGASGWMLWYAAQPYGVELETRYFYDINAVVNHLETQGPVIAGVWLYELGHDLHYYYTMHWILLLGVEGDEIVYHDPLREPFMHATKEDMWNAIQGNWPNTAMVIKDSKEALWKYGHLLWH